MPVPTGTGFLASRLNREIRASLCQRSRTATRAIRRVNTAARGIAEGRFDVRVPEKRSDELGELGGSVNAMTAQLGELVGRQRRLTADVAHELCSPIARMQRALGIVEQRAAPEQAAYLKKLDGELQHMARLVEEVLSFTKASGLPALVAPEEFAFADLVSEIVAREAGEARVEVHIAADLRVRTIREALDRALLTIADCFRPALAALAKLATRGLVWADCEALERRHNLGRGALVVLDVVPECGAPNYVERRAMLESLVSCDPVFAGDTSRPVPSGAVVLTPSLRVETHADALAFYRRLRAANRVLGCDFFEGVVMKRPDSIYPVQLRSMTEEFRGWVKHRFLA